MFRKTLTIVAIGISVLAMGTVKSNAQCALHFGAVVGASVSTAQGTVDYTIHDWIGIDCVHYIMITYVNEKTRASGTATETSIGTSSFSASGATYSGKMLVGKNWADFTLSLDASAPAIAFTLAKTKTSAAVNNVNTLTAGSYDIWLNP